MIASLSMYERPETQDVLSHLWRGVRNALLERGIDAPLHLCANACNIDTWLDDGLVLSQTCGLPFRTRLHQAVQLVGSPNCRLSGCPPGYYRSAIVVRANDSRDSLIAFESSPIVCNERSSQSGYAALKHHWETAKLSWPAEPRFSGAHRASALAVANGDADLTALDAVSYRLIQQHDSFAAQLRVLEYTQPTPALPFICSKRFNLEHIKHALRSGIRTLTEVQQDSLGLYGIVDVPTNQYLQVPTPPESIAP